MDKENHDRSEVLSERNKYINALREILDRAIAKVNPHLERDEEYINLMFRLAELVDNPEIGDTVDLVQVLYQALTYLEEVEKAPAYNIQPVGSIAKNALIVLTHELQGKPIRSTKDTRYTAKTDMNGKRTIEIERPYDKQFSSYKISITNIDIFKNKRDNITKKLFNLILAESNAQNNPENIMIRPSKLVELGMYKSTDAARRAITQAIPKLQSLAVEGTIGYGKTKRLISRTVLFPDYAAPPRTDAVYITLNAKLRPTEIAGYYSLFPSWGYALSNRAYDLLFYIQGQAVQRNQSGAITRGGAFNASIEHVANYLGLPHPDDTKNPGRDIVNEISEAITEIENAQRKAKRRDIYITAIYEENEDGSPDTRHYYSRGYLKIEYEKVLLDYFKNRSEKRKTKRKEMTKTDKKSPHSVR